MSCSNCKNCNNQQAVVQPKTKIHYMLVRVDTDEDIERIIGFIETIETKISSTTRIDVEQVSTVSTEREEQDECPVIYWP